MEDPTWLSQFLQYGPGIALAVLVFYAYDKHVNQLRDIIQKNTEALTAVQKALEATVSELKEHDIRADRIENSTVKIYEKIDRIEVATRGHPAAKPRA